MTETLSRRKNRNHQGKRE